MFQDLKDNLLNLFFPPYCAGCNRIGEFLCETCKKEIEVFPRTFYPRKLHCSYLSGVVSAGYYNNEILKEAIHKFKYEGITSLSPIFAGILAKRLKEENIIFDLIAFTPTTKKKQFTRGYNQAELLAIELSKHFKNPIIHTLQKTKETKAQVGLLKKEREKNLKSAFRCLGPSLCDKTILLVDDVFTTGTTLNECAKALKKKEAGKIYGAVLARE